MKTQQFTEQQLKDLVNGKKIVTAQPVKKGERLVEHYKTKSLEINTTIYLDNKKSVCRVSELVQATNEKSEKLFTCYCNDGKGYHPFHVGFDYSKPLLVRLEKIEKAINLEENKFIKESYSWLKTWRMIK